MDSLLHFFFISRFTITLAQPTPIYKDNVVLKEEKKKKRFRDFATPNTLPSNC